MKPPAPPPSSAPPPSRPPAAPDGCLRAHAEFAERCAAIPGTQAVLLGPDGAMLPPSQSAPGAHGLRADHRGVVARLAANHLASADVPPVIDLADGDGRVAILLPHRRGSEVVASTVAVLRGQPHEVQQRIPMLRWMFADLCRIHADAVKLDQFNERLTGAYEHVNLMFRLAPLLNADEAPAAQASQALAQLREVLPFRWLALRFHEDRGHSTTELAGRTLIAGEIPMEDEGAFAMLADAIVADAGSRPPDQWARVLGPEDSPLARACGGGQELVAEPVTHDARVVGLLLAGNKLGADPQVSSEDAQVLAAASSFLGTFHENVSRFTEQRDLFFSTVAALSRTIEAKDPYTRGHSERVSLLAQQMALAMRFDRRRSERYRIAGLVHDLGKIGVPEAVLRKPGQLTTDEFILIRRHPEIGYNILKDIPGMADALPAVLHHHEQWDGRGYPRGLAGEAIPLIARVLALADTFDAMRSRRAYRDAMPRAAALAEISRCAGTHYDPALVPIFMKLDFTSFDRMLAEPLPPTERCAA